MQKVVYKCDQCFKEIGPKVHISIRFTNDSGIVTPPTKNDTGTWQISPALQGKFSHFCNGQCAGRYFSDLMKSKTAVKK